MKTLIVILSMVSATGIATVASEPTFYENVPSVEKAFKGNGDPVSDVAVACEVWVKDTTEELQRKGMTILKSGCARNVIVAPPVVVFYGKVDFIR